MIEQVLIGFVLLLMIAMIGLFFYVKTLEASMKQFVLAQIDDLIAKINQSKLYEFNHDKQKDEYIMRLNQQFRNVSTLMTQDS